jgi:hypothetical protein
MSVETTEELTPTIIGVADSTHYLVGCLDKQHNLVGLSPEEDVTVLNSLVEAKDFLRDHNISSALLEFQTAYDEMCGNPSPSRVTERISL